MATTVRGELEEEFLSTLRKGQEIALDALKTLVDSVQFVRTPVRMPFADRLPTAQQVVAEGYDFSERLLANQRQFADEVIKVMSPLRQGRAGKLTAK
jgi:hypothetical protein